MITIQALDRDWFFQPINKYFKSDKIGKYFLLKRPKTELELSEENIFKLSSPGWTSSTSLSRFGTRRRCAENQKDGSLILQQKKLFYDKQPRLYKLRSLKRWPIAESYLLASVIQWGLKFWMRLNFGWSNVFGLWSDHSKTELNLTSLDWFIKHYKTIRANCRFVCSVFTWPQPQP